LFATIARPDGDHTTAVLTIVLEKLPEPRVAVKREDPLYSPTVVLLLMEINCLVTGVDSIPGNVGNNVGNTPVAKKTPPLDPLNAEVNAPAVVTVSADRDAAAVVVSIGDVANEPGSI